MKVFQLARKINRYLKQRQKQSLSRYLSPVRRIERVAPVPGQRVVAMTFDDGPSAAPLAPGGGSGLTVILLDILAQYQAFGTFDVVGTTAHNYPDREGKLHTAQWSGISHDHYPAFSMDHLGGVVNQPELVRRMVAEGHELANHTYSHVAFGPTRWVYGSRSYLPDLAAVVEDLRKLHDLVLEQFGYAMRLSRPPHYIDPTKDGKSAYDAYRVMGYQYLAASFDGGGWMPTTGDYRRDVDKMVEPLAAALKAEPESLNGQIIFQKDGYNMSKETPVADALPRQLALLQRYGYRVITVSQLLDLSPFTDLPGDHPVFGAARALANRGHVVGYQDNTFQPDRVLTRGELAVMISPPGDGVHAELASNGGASKPAFRDVPSSHPYYREVALAHQRGWIKGEGHLFQPDRPVTGEQLTEVIRAMGRTPAGMAGAKALGGDSPWTGPITRGQAALVLAESLGG